jgi:alanyl-tRNA synthetase
MTEKLYWKDPYKKEFTAKIVEIIDKKGVILDRTLFYPQGGGQAPDKGYFSIKGKNIPVKNVTIEESKILHHLDSKVIKTLKVNEEIRGKIDWKYRYGLMRAHSAQHLISAVFKNNFGIETESAYIESDEVILKLSNSINFNQLYEVLIKSNEISTQKNLKIIEEIYPRDKVLEKYSGLRGKIPKENPIRVIKIEDLDVICCGGTHLKNINDIGVIHIYEFKGGNEIKFYVGSNSIDSITRTNIDLLKLIQRESVKLSNFKAKFSKIFKDIRDLEEENESLKLKLIDFTLKNPDSIIRNINIFYLEFSMDYDLLTKKINEIPENSLLIVINPQNRIRIISKVENIKANDIISLIKERFNAKGGGSDFNAQIYIVDNFEEAKIRLKEIIKEKIETLQT